MQANSAACTVIIPNEPMKTEKLYENNSYQAVFSATVTDCFRHGDKFAIILDKTCFFPNQGGQYADNGSLNCKNVEDVQIVGGEIYHLLSSPFTIGEKVEGKVDMRVRFRRMQTHTGEHILSGVIHNLFGFDNVGFHLGDGYATVDTSGKLTRDDIACAEEEANKVVWQDRAVTASYPTIEEAKNLSFRSKIDLQEGIRLITIDGCDVCACCAPHLSSTGQVGLIKVVAHEPHKQGTRLTVLCGEDAYRYVAQTQDLLQNAMRFLSATPETLLSELSRLSSRLTNAEKEIKALKFKCAQSNLSFTQGKKAEYAFVEGADMEVLRALALSVTSENIRVLLSLSGDAFLYAAFSSKADVRPFVKDMNAALSGKGGGTPSFAQGKIFVKKEDIALFLNDL